MSWLFSQALVEEYLAGTCSDGEPSAPSNGNPIPQAYCAPAKMTAFSRLSRFGMTFAPLTADLGEELLTLFRGAFPVRTSVQQDAAPESTESGAECGGTWRESLAKLDPVTSLWKIPQCSLFEDLMLSSPTLPRWGSMQSGELFRRQTLVPPIAETESGLLPTPLASNTKAHHLRSGGRPARSYLIPTPTMWPTPTSTLGTNGGLVTPSKGREGGTLIEALSARTLWPTPTVCGNYNRKGLSANSGDGLATAVATWPTPTAQDAKNNGAPSQMMRNTKPLNAEVGGSLNPVWVEWLMGWPLGWTDLKPLETDKYQQWLQQHGVY